jgi:hypothetical protein
MVSDVTVFGFSGEKCALPSSVLFAVFYDDDASEFFFHRFEIVGFRAVHARDPFDVWLVLSFAPTGIFAMTLRLLWIPIVSFDYLLRYWLVLVPRRQPW